MLGIKTTYGFENFGEPKKVTENVVYTYNRLGKITEIVRNDGMKYV